MNLTGLANSPQTGGLREPPGQPDRLKQAAQDFEALLLTRLLKVMRGPEGKEASGMSLGSGNPLQGMFDWELARSLAQRSPLGIADIMRGSLERGEETAGALPPGELATLAARAGRAHGVDPKLVQAVISAESGGDPGAVSIRGAKGLMQLLDSTAAQQGVADPFDPEQNVMGGTALLRSLLDRYSGDLQMALAAYNAGPEAVDHHGGVPPYRETRDYVDKIVRLYNRNSNSQDKPTESPASEGESDE